jgi:NAD(P)-dependent dehydrogenase (short-subunit alcohol dehydrogenase family)
MTDYTKAYRLDGKVALVTGAARGLGAEIARAFSQVGAKVLIADVLDEAGRAVAAQIAGPGATAAFAHLDVTQEADWERAVGQALREWGGLHVLVNSAGVETAALISQCEAEDFRRVLDINVTGTFLGLKHAIRAMSPGGAAGRGGSIVNIASIAAMVGTSAHIAYHTSKGGVRSLSMAAAIECAQLGLSIRVNSVYPGIVGTAMGRSFISDFVKLKLAPDEAAAEAAIKAGHPLGFGQPEDVACAVLYLASDAARWCTGTELVIDGGYTAA